MLDRTSDRQGHPDAIVGLPTRRHLLISEQRWEHQLSDPGTRDFTVAFLRAAGVPARARCGFGAYFRPGWFEDHWVVEYWNATAARWQLVDAQLDATWCEKIGFTGNALAITPTSS